MGKILDATHHIVTPDGEVLTGNGFSKMRPLAVKFPSQQIALDTIAKLQKLDPSLKMKAEPMHEEKKKQK